MDRGRRSCERSCDGGICTNGGINEPAKPGWQLEQEHNIAYVAYSRSKSELYFVAEHIMQCPRFVQDLLMPDTVDTSGIYVNSSVVEPTITPEPIITVQPIETTTIEQLCPVQKTARTQGKKGESKGLVGVAYNFPPDVAEKLNIASALIAEKHGKKLDRKSVV